MLLLMPSLPPSTGVIAPNFPEVQGKSLVFVVSELRVRPARTIRSPHLIRVVGCDVRSWHDLASYIWRWLVWWGSEFWWFWCFHQCYMTETKLGRPDLFFIFGWKSRGFCCACLFFGINFFGNHDLLVNSDLWTFITGWLRSVLVVSAHQSFLMPYRGINID